MTRDMKLTDEEIQVLQRTLIAKYKDVAIEQNNTIILLLDLLVPPDEIERLFKGCANAQTLEAFRDKAAQQPAIPAEPKDVNFRQFEAIVNFVRDDDKEATAYGNTPKDVQSLWPIYMEREQAVSEIPPCNDVQN